MRGKVKTLESYMGNDRITPAYAGKSDVSRMSFPMYEDHPRLCGEKFFLLLFLKCRPGSPPPMRGKEINPRIQLIESRITPAYAGKRDYTCLHQT